MRSPQWLARAAVPASAARRDRQPASHAARLRQHAATTRRADEAGDAAHGRPSRAARRPGAERARIDADRATRTLTSRSTRASPTPGYAQARARRLPGARRQLRRLPHGARRRALRRRARIETPFGTVYASNLTPDARPASATGRRTISGARCTTAARETARCSIPAFPYPNYTQRDACRRRCDVRLPAQPAAGRAAQPAARRCAFRTTTAGCSPAGACSISARRVQADCAHRDAEWNRGAYLVQGLGHCNACHPSRNVLGGPPEGGPRAAG